MKVWLRNTLIGCVVFYAGIFLFAQYVVPKLAILTIPFKWRHIPVGESRETVHEYLGLPLKDSFNISQKDIWENTRERNKKYVLEIVYNKDTLAQSCKLYYRAGVLGFTQNYCLQSDTLR
jgi:hypothetical protein